MVGVAGLTIDGDLALHIASLILAAGVSWGVVKTKMTGYDRRHEQHDTKTEQLGNRILNLEQTVADRVARIETKVDLLLSAYLRDIRSPEDK